MAETSDPIWGLKRITSVVKPRIDAKSNKSNRWKDLDAKRIGIQTESYDSLGGWLHSLVPSQLSGRSKLGLSFKVNALERFTF
jgi:hypothetical protein